MTNSCFKTRHPRLGLLKTRAVVATTIAITLSISFTSSALASSLDTNSISVKVDSWLSRMTLDEKLQMVHGTGRPPVDHPPGYAGKIAGLPRLGIPEIVFADGPTGVGNGTKDVTAFPAPISNAATWDSEKVQQFGAALGEEQLAKGNNVVLAPTINLIRVPQWGRSYEASSEDPYLTGRLAVAEINGIQNQGVTAAVKHLAANNQEYDRAFVDAEIDERTLRELYLRAFEMTVRDAHVRSVMCSYNKVNGKYACESRHLLSDILKGEWGFKGFVVSDWAATHSTEKSANAGLDVEMPYGPAPGYPVFFGPALKEAVVASNVSVTRLDDMVRRVLTSMAESQDSAARSVTASKALDTHQRLAFDLSAEGMVLLKNNSGLLPFGADVRSIAVIGTAADSGLITSGVGSAAVLTSSLVTPLAGIRKRAGSAIDITYAKGTFGTGPLPVMSDDALDAKDGHKGFSATYYASRDFTGTPLLRRLESHVEFKKSPITITNNIWSARYTASFTPKTSGGHRFSLTASGIATLYIDGKPVLHNYGRDRSGVAHALVDLRAGVPVSMRVDYIADIIEKRTEALQLGWLAPDPQLLKQAVDAARKAKVAVVFVNDIKVEGNDEPSLALPGDQNALVEAIAAVNPRTVVVMNTGGAALMPWLGRVRAVLEAWYPGEQGGNAIAALLFGDLDPAGKLPISFPQSDTDTPVALQRRWPGINDVATYDEHLLIGYRWFDATATTPLFPFGYGLSYTQFSYAGMHLSTDPDRAKRIALDIKNIGAREGAEVAQLYLAFPAAAHEPPRQLRCFQRIALAAGEAKKLTFVLTRRDLSIWDEKSNGWKVLPGKYKVMIGSSSRDIRTQATFIER